MAWSCVGGSAAQLAVRCLLLTFYVLALHSAGPLGEGLRGRVVVLILASSWPLVWQASQRLVLHEPLAPVVFMGDTLMSSWDSLLSLSCVCARKTPGHILFL